MNIKNTLTIREIWWFFDRRKQWEILLEETEKNIVWNS